MTLFLDASTINYLKGTGGGLDLGIFFRLDSDPALHVWLGVNDIPIGIPSTDLDGTVYLGAGRLQSIPNLELLLNGIASRVTFQLSGIDQDNINNLYADAPPVTGKKAVVGIAPLDKRKQPQTQIIPLWTGYADVWKLVTPPQPDITQARIYTISLSLAAGDSRRSFPKLTSFTDPQQRMVSPTDAFCARVSRYVQSLLITWPRYN